MKKLYKIYSNLLLALLIGTAGHVFAQPYQTPEKLDIQWQVYQNHYQGKDQTLFSIGMHNGAKQAFPAQGWRIYFNLGKRVTTIAGTEQLKINHVNGGLYYIAPGKDFKSLAPGGSVAQQFISNSWVVNKSDAPQGFYLVWDNAPGTGIP